MTFQWFKAERQEKTLTEKIKHINAHDPYKIPKNEWEDDVKSWPDVTYIHVGLTTYVKNGAVREVKTFKSRPAVEFLTI